MKKILTIVFVAIFLPSIASSDVCHDLEPKIIKNELPCIKIPEVTCGGGLEFKNGCEEDVYYTNLSCWDDGFDSYRDRGFIILENEVTLSRNTFSLPSVYNRVKYFGRINYLGGAWLPCKFPESFYDPDTKQITVQLRKGNKIYEIVGSAPYDAPRIKPTQRLFFIIIIIVVLISMVFYVNKRNKK